MKLFFRYLKGRLGTLLLLAGFALLFAATFALYRLPPEAVLYPAALCLAIAAILAAMDFARFKKRHARLLKLQRLTDALPDLLPRALGPEAEDWREIALLVDSARREERARAEASFQAMTDYYTLWAHEIKTPIAAMRLKLQGRDDPEARDLLGELGRVERYVDMVLTYLRLEGSGTDYVIREVDVDDVLRGVFRQFSEEFIGRKLKLNYTPTLYRALTDEKWLAFVVGQVLSNALKYTPSGAISVYMEPPGTLCVSDTGIGIAPEDLPRVFEQSYTGLTGRVHGRASGLGLYLCKRVCDNLGHGIWIQSTPGEGTTVRLELSRRKVPIQ